MVLFAIDFQEASFADSTNQNTHETTESTICSILWRWKFTDAAERDALIADCKLALLIEFWFPFSQIEYTRRRGTWCDGIPLMDVAAISRTAFRIVGVGYFPHWMTPFELEFHFDKRRDTTPQRIILRLGHVPHVRHQTGGHSKHPQNILISKPTKDSDWAVAVELVDVESEDSG